MTTIQLKTSSVEFKAGFRAAMKMILVWCEHKSPKTIEELELALRGGLMIDDLMQEMESDK